MLRHAGLAIVTVFLISLTPQILDAKPKRAAAAVTRLGYGAIVSDLRRLESVRNAGFNWVKIAVSWKGTQPTRTGGHNWSSVDTAVGQALSNGLSILIRVDDSPQWASGSWAFNAPPLDDRDLAEFMYQLAVRFRGRVKAYEIWNEPNVITEWGGQNPSPAKHARMLQALYPRVKLADPGALVITGGLATTGDGNGSSVHGDLLFIKHIYDPNEDGDLSDGAKGYFDAIGSHPYGGPYEPERAPSDAPLGAYFRRAEQHRQMMEVWGREDKPIFLTEFGWLLDPAEEGVGCDLGPYFNQFKVSALTQGNYLVRAFQYAQTYWPWAGPMIVFNLDLSADWYRDQCDIVRWFSLLRPDGSPWVAYSLLAQMPKPYTAPASLALDATSLTFYLEPDAGNLATQRLDLRNSGDGPLTWAASVAGAPWVSASPSGGIAPASLTVTVNKARLPNGWHQSSFVLANSSNGASLPSQIVQVRLYVGPVTRLYFPMSFR